MAGTRRGGEEPLAEDWCIAKEERHVVGWFSEKNLGVAVRLPRDGGKLGLVYIYVIVV
jgi:hypothetical protein